MSDDLSLPSPYEPLVDRETGKVSELWYRYLNGLNTKVNGINHVTSIAHLPTTADVESGKWAVFRDSSGGTSRLSYNHNSTMLSVALTT
jgi:hypothetical protein